MSYKFPYSSILMKHMKLNYYSIELISGHLKEPTKSTGAPGIRFFKGIYTISKLISSRPT
jgi:hypothetical protein